ncbi:MAG: ATP-binding cassette domain-containing protein [Spirochaetales bacterium]|jgi:ABC-2 type transport system ATP-binding protein|nr:ATP-binding cassette domain-containing protein [Spirochaetales bacterium]
MIEVANVSKSFDSVQAVKEVNFTAGPGEIFGLIGPNGAGKSTIIRMIMNIIAPDTGKILFDGKPIEEKDKERIGYLPEERGLYKKTKVNDMLMYLGELKGGERLRLQEQIDYWLEHFDLMHWKDKPISELSKGMSQKVQFTAAVAHEPDILFFDEPFAGLDPVSSDLLRDSITELSRSGKTVLFSTHIMEQAERLCNRIFLINRGDQVVYGSLEEIKEAHGSNSVVVEFDGDGSFIRDLPGVASATSYQRYVEVELSEGCDPDDLLSQLVGKISIMRFEVVSPSLHNIFISMVGADNAEEKGE